MEPRLRQILTALLSLGLLFWGGYATLFYLGVPVHGMVLLTQEAQDAIAKACTDDAMLCRGWQAFFPFVFHTIGRAQPFLWYGILCAALFGAYLCFQWMKTGKWEAHISLAPWRLLLLFLCSLWLIFTTFSFSEFNGQPFRRLFEPLPQVYVNANPQALEVLQQNFHDLQDRNCLSPAGQTNNGAGVFMIKHRCIQSAFLSRVLPQAALVLFLLFELLILGRLCMQALRFRPGHPLVEVTLGLGLGACAWILLLWTLAVVSLYTQAAAWLLIIAVPVVGYRHVHALLRRCLDARWEVQISARRAEVFLFWLLITYIAFNFLNVVRPFPIGWDDLGSYLNRPRLLVSYGHFIPSMSSLQWEYLTSLGFLLFGYDSIFGATAAMIINWTAGLLAILSIFTFAHVFLGSGGLLSALLYYSLPLVGHFSFADMKVDNAVFTMGALGMLAMFLALFTGDVAEEAAEEQSSRTINWHWLALAGIFLGFGFGMKPTMVMVLMATGAVLFGSWLHWVGFLGVAAMTVWLYAFQGTPNLGEIAARIYGNPEIFNREQVMIVSLLLGGVLLACAVYLRRRALSPLTKACVIFGASFFLSVAPWILHNNILSGNVIPHLILNAPNTLSPVFDIVGGGDGPNVRSLPPELTVTLDNPACKGTSKTEELDRYWGYGGGWSHYLTLPWRTVMNIDSAGYYVTTVPALLLFPLLLLLPFFWTKQGKWLRWLWAATAFLLVQWIFLANGIPWYGVGVFLGLCICLEALCRRAPELFSRCLASGLIAMSLLIAFGMRLWQFESQQNLFEYPLGKVSAEGMRERTIPHYDDIRNVVLERSRSDRPYTFRVGTFIPYFIPKNLELLPVADNQLELFNCLHQERNPALTLQRLKALGFNGIIFDTNTATIERDLSGTLHQKVQAFADFINTPELGLQIVVNDPDAGIAYILIP